MITIADRPVELIHEKLYLGVTVDIMGILTMLEAVVTLLWKH